MPRQVLDAGRIAIALPDWAADHAVTTTIASFRPNPATRTLLEVNFRVDDIDTFVASRADLLDLGRYFPSPELG